MRRLAFLLLLLPVAAFGADQCFECHGLNGLGAFEKPSWITPDNYADSLHRRLACTDCHKGIVGLPHQKSAEIRCDLPCHAQGKNHEVVVKEVKSSVHANVDDPSCSTCHTGGVAPKGELTEALCVSCHGGLDHDGEIYPSSTGSMVRRAHKAAQAGKRAPSCRDCHGWHDVKDGKSARAACSQKGCHPGATQAFGELYDHGKKGRSDLFGVYGYVASGLALLMGAAWLASAGRSKNV